MILKPVRPLLASLSLLFLGSIWSNETTAQGAQPPPPTYKPAKAWSATGGVAGRTLSGLETASGTTYSSDVVGPFGGTLTARQSQSAGGLWFGAYPLKGLNLREGSDLWIRIYQYFPEDYCFSYGNEGDGWGATKWIRAQTSSGRSTIELGSASPNPSSEHSFKRAPSCGATTAMYGDINEMGAGNRPFPNYTAAPLVRGRWQAIQVHWHFSSTDGFIRGWVDDVYLGQSNHTTLRSGATVQEIVFGDYWNGGAPKNQSFYYDEIVITTQAPNTVDSGGRPFIHPKTRVSNFTNEPPSLSPTPPSGLTVR